MSIQNRRGNYGDFDKSKMLAGEFAVVLEDDPDTSDGKAAYIAFSPGSAKRLMTAEDARDIINNGIEAATQDVVDAITDATAQDVADAQAAQEAAEEAAEEAGQILSNKADIDGSYPNLAAGQLLSKTYTEIKVPYHFKATKPSASADIGDREYLEIVGGSVGWNQLIKNNRDSGTVASVTVTRNSDGSVTLNGTADSNSSYALDTASASTPISHVFFCSGYVKTGSNLGYFGFAGENIDKGSGGIWKNTSNYTSLMPRIDLRIGDTFSNVTMYCYAIDLTQMFGSTIADYIYTLETATAGAGVAKLKSWGFFTKDYYVYDAGSLKSVEGLESHDTVGFNQFDKSTATDGKYVTASMEEVVSASYGHSAIISVFPSTKYHMTGYGGAGIYSVLALDADKNPISNYYGGAAKTEPFDCTLPNNCYYVILNYWLNQKDTVCFNLSWSGYRNGEYEPYVKHSYPLDSSLTLRGIPKKDDNGNLYFDGDTYEADGTVTKKYAEVTLNSSGSYSISIGTERNRISWNDYESIGKFNGTFISDKLTIIANDSGGFGSADWQVFGSTFAPRMWITVPSSIATVEDFKTYLSTNPITVVYELATPTTETADPFQSPQIVDDFGTEEFVTDSIVPVGHITKYPANLRERIESIPVLPTTAGSYRLQVTIVSGKPVYEWVTT